MARIRISWGSGEVTADLRETPTVKQLLKALPSTSRAQTWGEEVYFRLPVQADLEADARQDVAPGAVCFWVEGSSLALPYGRTPASQGDEPRLVTRCNVLGKIEGDPRQLRKVKEGESIRVELLPGKA
jgi:uncharacterized protein